MPLFGLPDPSEPFYEESVDEIIDILANELPPPFQSIDDQLAYLDIPTPPTEINCLWIPPVATAEPSRYIPLTDPDSYSAEVAQEEKAQEGESPIADPAEQVVTFVPAVVTVPSRKRNRPGKRSREKKRRLIASSLVGTTLPAGPSVANSRPRGTTRATVRDVRKAIDGQFGPQAQHFVGLLLRDRIGPCQLQGN